MKKRLPILLFVFASLSSVASDKSDILPNNPEPKVPQRESTRSDEAELMFQHGNANHQSVESRQVKENQEDIDPIFYDATTSPAELKNVD